MGNKQSNKLTDDQIKDALWQESLEGKAFIDIMCQKCNGNKPYCPCTAQKFKNTLTKQQIKAYRNRDINWKQTRKNDIEKVWKHHCNSHMEYNDLDFNCEVCNVDDEICDCAKREFINNLTYGQLNTLLELWNL